MGRSQPREAPNNQHRKQVMTVIENEYLEHLKKKKKRDLEIFEFKRHLYFPLIRSPDNIHHHLC